MTAGMSRPSSFIFSLFFFNEQNPSLSKQPAAEMNILVQQK